MWPKWTNWTVKQWSGWTAPWTSSPSRARLQIPWSKLKTFKQKRGWVFVLLNHHLWNFSLFLTHFVLVSRNCSPLVTLSWPSPNPKWRSPRRKRPQSRTVRLAAKRRRRRKLQTREPPRTQGTQPQKLQRTSLTWTLTKTAQTPPGAKLNRGRLSQTEMRPGSVYQSWWRVSGTALWQWNAGRATSTQSPAPDGTSIRHSMPSLFLDDLNQKPAAINLFDNERCTHDGIYFCCVPCNCSVSQPCFNKVVENLSQH